MERETRCLRRRHRMRRSWEFRRASRQGRRSADRSFVLLAVDHPEGTGVRLGLTVSRRVGNAVVRNRVKRAVREWFRHTHGALRDGVDLVVIARRPAAQLVTREVAEVLGELALRVEAAR